MDDALERVLIPVCGAHGAKRLPAEQRGERPRRAGDRPGEDHPGRRCYRHLPAAIAAHYPAEVSAVSGAVLKPN
jgi:hypothetical protein